MWWLWLSFGEDEAVAGVSYLLTLFIINSKNNVCLCVCETEKIAVGVNLKSFNDKFMFCQINILPESKTFSHALELRALIRIDVCCVQCTHTWMCTYSPNCRKELQSSKGGRARHFLYNFKNEIQHCCRMNGWLALGLLTMLQ